MKPKVEYITQHSDDRGIVYCVIDDMQKFPIRRTYLVHNWKAGMIRAWHGHKRAWTGLHVISGAAKVAAKPISVGPHNRKDDLDVTTEMLSEWKPGVFWVPPGYYNGSMSIFDNTKILVYSTLTFDEVKSDDERLALTDMDKKYVFEVKNR